MPDSKYRIESITIEGFRGFTAPQTIEINGKHVFIFGPNGYGKSSIIEAIRWCLFGSPGRDIQVRNTFYESGQCSVSMVLARDGARLTLSRELRPGATESRYTIRNNAGTVVLEKDALPQLARIGHRQGAQVIFAAQHAVGRQSKVDVSDFTSVLCFYLNLESVPDLVDDLENRIEEYLEQAKEMAASLERVAAGFREKLKEVDTRLSELLANPPWGDASPPTSDETETAVWKFVDEQARFYQKDRQDVKPRGALTRSKRWINDAGEQASESLQPRADALQEKVNQGRELLKQLDEAVTTLDSHRARHTESGDLRLKLLGGRALDDLRSDLEHQEAVITEASARLTLLQGADDVRDRWSHDKCPVCRTDFRPDELIDRITEAEQELEATSSDVQARENLRQQVKEAEALTASLEEQAEACAQGEEELKKVHAKLCALFSCEEGPVKVFEELIKDAEADLANVEQELCDAISARDKRLERIRRLEQQLRFHEYRDQVERFQWQLKDGMKEARERLSDYRDRLASTTQLAQAVDECFNEVLDRAVSPLNEMMTAVYRRLTGQKSYDLVRVVPDSEKRRRRELRVATSRLEGQTFPLNVLNGQAEKAIQLVPYFIFSKFHRYIMELDLLLIDDPSQSFDTSRVGRLVNELADASTHAQLVVATHEKEKFENHLASAFADDSYLQLMVASFNPLKGPGIERG